jgi:hypothetical protein
MNGITYRGGYKYQLRYDYAVDTGIRPEKIIKTEYLLLTSEGGLTIRRGYAWDGPSGPTLDSANFMRGSLVHDAFYQLMREGHLDKKTSRKKVDLLLYRMCRDDGMCWLRAQWVYIGVHYFADLAANPSANKPLLQAP